MLIGPDLQVPRDTVCVVGKQAYLLLIMLCLKRIYFSISPNLLGGNACLVV